MDDSPRALVIDVVAIGENIKRRGCFGASRHTPPVLMQDDLAIG